MTKKRSKTRYESPFARIFTQNGRKRDYWQPPVFLASFREEPHKLQEEIEEDVAPGSTWGSRIAGIILGGFLFIGGIQSTVNPIEKNTADPLFSKPVDVVSGLFCATLGAFILWLCFRKWIKKK